MSNEREVDIYVAQILDQTDRPQDMVDLMKRVIELNPDLNPDERNLLSVAYKNVVSQRRDGLRSLQALFEREQENPTRIAMLQEFRQTMVEELEKYCNDLVELIDTSLLPNTNSTEARVFYEKMKADYYRYICEFTENEEREEVAEKAKACYDNAIEIAKNDIPAYKPSRLGLMLNYSVFLYEIMGDKQEAIDLSQKTYSECSSLVEENSENSYNEATMILQLLRDNVALWTQ